MKPHHKKLMRDQLSTTLNLFNDLKSINPPQKGWIRAIRDALGINARQFAERLGVNKSRITRIEHDELNGGLTIKTMRRLADALDCVFVYGFVPRTTLDDTIKKQAVRVMRKRMSRVVHTMILEDQGLSDSEKQKAFESAVDELIRTMPKSLWDIEK